MGKEGQRWHPSVRIERASFRALRVRFAALAAHCSVEELGRELRAIGVERYAPVRDQLRILRRAVNRRRKAAGLELVPREAVWLRRRPVKPFGE